MCQKKNTLKKLGFFLYFSLNSEDREMGSAVCMVVWQIMQSHKVVVFRSLSMKKRQVRDAFVYFLFFFSLFFSLPCVQTVLNRTKYMLLLSVEGC